MHLMDPKMVEQMMMVPANPLHRRIATLDQEMRAVLENNELSDAEKVTKYNQILQHYLGYLQTPPALNSPSSIPTQGVREEVLQTVPKTLRRKAETILDRISREPNMSWNERGEFVYNGEVIKGSNVVDLVNDMIRQRKSFQPRGWEDFARALRQSNVPQDLVGNPRRWEWMHRESATSDAFSTADEKSPVKPTPRRPKLRTPACHRSRGPPRKSARISKKEESKWDPI